MGKVSQCQARDIVQDVLGEEDITLGEDDITVKLFECVAEISLCTLGSLEQIQVVLSRRSEIPNVMMTVNYLSEQSGKPYMVCQLM